VVFTHKLDPVIDHLDQPIDPHPRLIQPCLRLDGIMFGDSLVQRLDRIESAIPLDHSRDIPERRAFLPPLKIGPIAEAVAELQPDHAALRGDQLGRFIAQISRCVHKMARSPM